MVGCALGVKPVNNYRIKWVPITDVNLMLPYLFDESQIEMKKKSVSPSGCMQPLQEDAFVAMQ
jgi:hypothetical protein